MRHSGPRILGPGTGWQGTAAGSRALTLPSGAGWPAAVAGHCDAIPVPTRLGCSSAMPPPGVAGLSGTRRAIETCVREGKQLLGPGDYEGRNGQGWHRHMTRCMFMHGFLPPGKLVPKNNPA